MVERRRDPHPSPTNERPLNVRRRKADLAARVNGNLPLEFDDVALTSYAGLELFARYLRRIDFKRVVRHAFADLPAWGDFGVVAMVRVVVGLVVVGGRRLRHVAYVADDPVFQRFGGVRLVPTARTLSRWLRHFTMPTVRHLQALNAAVVSHLLPTLGLRTWTVDVDGVVVSTGCRSNGRRVATTRTSARCPATTRSWRTWPRRRTSCGSRIGRATASMGRRGCRSCVPCGPSWRACARAGPGCASAWMGRFSARTYCGGCRAAPSATATPALAQSDCDVDGLPRETGGQTRLAVRIDKGWQFFPPNDDGPPYVLQTGGLQDLCLAWEAPPYQRSNQQIVYASTQYRDDQPLWLFPQQRGRRGTPRKSPNGGDVANQKS